MPLVAKCTFTGTPQVHKAAEVAYLSALLGESVFDSWMGFLGSSSVHDTRSARKDTSTDPVRADRGCWLDWKMVAEGPASEEYPDVPVSVSPGTISRPI